MTLSEQEQEDLSALAGGLADEKTERRARELIARSSEAAVYYEDVRARVAMLESALGERTVEEPATPEEIEAFVRRVEQLRRKEQLRRQRVVALSVVGLAACIALLLTPILWLPTSQSKPPIAAAVLFVDGGRLAAVNPRYETAVFSAGQQVRASSGGILTLGKREVILNSDTTVMLDRTPERFTLLRGAVSIGPGSPLVVKVGEEPVRGEVEVPQDSAVIIAHDADGTTEVMVDGGGAIARLGGAEPVVMAAKESFKWLPGESKPQVTPFPAALPSWVTQAGERLQEMSGAQERYEQLIREQLGRSDIAVSPK